MKITLVLVTSINGKLTQGLSSDVSSWTSYEDKKHFISEIEKNVLIIMGRKTYEAARKKMNVVPGKLRMVMTNHPEHYSHEFIPGQLEFTKESAEVLVHRLEEMEYTEALLVGGSRVASQFFREKLITDLYLTLEPKLFGKGTLFFNEIDKTIQLKLENVKQLNTQGTLLLLYNVIYTFLPSPLA